MAAHGEGSDTDVTNGGDDTIDIALEATGLLDSLEFRAYGETAGGTVTTGGAQFGLCGVRMLNAARYSDAAALARSAFSPSALFTAMIRGFSASPWPSKPSVSGSSATRPGRTFTCAA